HAEPRGPGAGLAGHAGTGLRAAVAPRRALVREARLHPRRGAWALRARGAPSGGDSPLRAPATLLPGRRTRARAVTTHDVVVGGAGPAGSATAILLAERGWSVLLLDKAAFPRPKICGEYLSPEAARILDRLGALKDVDEAGARPLRGMRIVAPDGTRLEGRYPTAGPWRGYRDHALAVPREILDRILLERARALTADARERHRVVGLRMDGGRVAGVRAEDAAGRPFEVGARLGGGADGRALGGGRAAGGGRGRPRLGGGARAGAGARASPAADGAGPGRGRARRSRRHGRDLCGPARRLHHQSGVGGGGEPEA